VPERLLRVDDDVCDDLRRQLERDVRVVAADVELLRHRTRRPRGRDRVPADGEIAESKPAAAIGFRFQIRIGAASSHGDTGCGTAILRHDAGQERDSCRDGK
jgi:hypothetical protein